MPSVIVVLGGVMSTSGASLIEQIGWKGADNRIIVGVIVTLLALLGVMVALYMRTRLQNVNEQAARAEKLFREYSEKAELCPTEVVRLRQLLAHADTPYAQVIFQSASLFERCMDAEVQLLLLTVKSEEKLAEEELVLASLRKKLGYGYLPLEHPLLSTRSIEVGQAVALYGSSNRVPLIHHAIVTLNHELFFRVQYNAETEDAVKFFVGQELKLVFARPTDGVYGVQVEICKIQGDAVIELYHTLALKRNQLRQFVRIEVNLPIKVRVMPSSKKEPREESVPKHFSAKMADLSGGGISFLCESPLVPGDLVSMQFSLATGAFAGVAGKILRVSIQEGKTATSYRHHVQFVQIEPRNRDRIVRYIFDKQRQQNQIR